jgi:hypothetical protein
MYTQSLALHNVHTKVVKRRRKNFMAAAAFNART